MWIRHEIPTTERQKAFVLPSKNLRSQFWYLQWKYDPSTALLSALPPELFNCRTSFNWNHSAHPVLVNYFFFNLTILLFKLGHANSVLCRRTKRYIWIYSLPCLCFTDYSLSSSISHFPVLLFWLFFRPCVHSWEFECIHVDVAYSSFCYLYLRSQLWIKGCIHNQNWHGTLLGIGYQPKERTKTRGN